MLLEGQASVTDGLLVQLKVTRGCGRGVTKHAPELELLRWVWNPSLPPAFQRRVLFLDGAPQGRRGGRLSQDVGGKGSAGACEQEHDRIGEEKKRSHSPRTSRRAHFCSLMHVSDADQGQCWKSARRKGPPVGANAHSRFPVPAGATQRSEGLVHHPSNTRRTREQAPCCHHPRPRNICQSTSIRGNWMATHPVSRIDHRSLFSWCPENSRGSVLCPKSPYASATPADAWGQGRGRGFSPLAGICVLSACI